jgi:cystathionine beta-lyase/cystathionine gamma-synthase
MSEMSTYQPVVPCFESVEALQSGLEAKSQFRAEDLYPRDGSQLLGEVEAKLACLAGISEENTLSYTSGMAAVTDAIDVALKASGKPQPTLACAEQTYSQTRRYIDNFLQGTAVKIVRFDSGNNNEITKLIEQKRPDVILTETISNYVDVPVLDTQFLLDAVRQQTERSVVVLDNTLPLSTVSPLGESLSDDDNVIVVESGTKSYTFNTELLGVGYSKSEVLLDYLRRYRRTRGSLPSTRSLEHIMSVLPEDREDFDERNLRLFRNTGDIAIRLAENLKGDEFLVSHPGLPTHDNYEFYTRQYPNQGTPVLYIQFDKQRASQYEVTELLWSNPDVQDQARLGQSFGFDHTRIVPDENVGTVRIAGGADTDGKVLGAALAEALNAR